MDILYRDKHIIVCIKPAGVVSTEAPGGMPALLREALGDEKAAIFPVHRLDRDVGGLMVYALSSAAAAALSRRITEGGFQKEYLALVHGCPEEENGRFDDLLFHDSAKNRSYVVKRLRKGVRDAALEYQVLEKRGSETLVKIRLLTGRTHQIRVQFASRRMPLVGDKKYGAKDGASAPALWSHSISFTHPATGKPVCFTAPCPWAGEAENLS